MPRFPYFGFPYPYYKNYYYNKPPSPNSFSNNSNNCNNNIIPEKKEDLTVNEDSFLFDLFGLKLYFDDILLICLIFFLYTEGVKDEGLFIALILLLLT